MHAQGGHEGEEHGPPHSSAWFSRWASPETQKASLPARRRCAVFFSLLLESHEQRRSFESCAPSFRRDERIILLVTAMACRREAHLLARGATALSLMVLLAFASLAAAQDSGEPLAHGGGVDGKAADHNVEAPQSSPPPPPPPSSSPPPAAPKQSAGARKAETSSASSKAAKTKSAACEIDVLLKEPVAVSLEVTGLFIAMSLALRWLPAKHPPHFDSAMANYWRSAPCTMNAGNFLFAFGGSPESAWRALNHILWPNALPSPPKIPSNLQRHDDRLILAPSDPRPR